MGGGIADVLVNVSKDAIDSMKGQFDKDEVSSLVSHLRSMHREYQKSEPGKDLYNLTQNYIQSYQQNLEAGVKANNNVGLIMGKTYQDHPLKVKMQARNRARKLVFGDNDSAGTYLIHQASKTPTMEKSAAKMHAQNLADFTATILHDYETEPKWRKMTEDELINQKLRNLGYMKEEKPLETNKSIVGGKSAPFSTFKRNAIQSKTYPTFLDESATYKPVRNIEHNFNQYTHRVVYPIIVAAHAAQNVNLTLTTPLSVLGKTAADIIGSMHGGTEFGKIMDFANKAGIFGNTTFDMYMADYYGSRGLVSKYTNDRLGKLFYNTIHQPLFNPARKMELAIAASGGYHYTLDMVDRLLKNPSDRMALFEFKKLGIDPKYVLKQQGELTDQQIQKAMWRFVDSRMFLDTSLHRAQLAGSHPTYRIMTMYHSYVGRQAHLLEDEFNKAWNAKDLKTWALLVGTIAIAFPQAGEMTKELTTASRGDFKDLHPIEDEKNMAFVNGPRAALREYIENYTHVGGFGIATSYIRGAARYGGANELLGPLGNAAWMSFVDSVHPLNKELVQGKPISFEDYKPLLRDAIEYNPFAVDNLGKLISHKVLPTKKEEAAKHLKTNMRFKKIGSKGFKFKKLQ